MGPKIPNSFPDNVQPGYFITSSGILFSRIEKGSHKLGNTYRARDRYSLSNGKSVKYLRTEIRGKKYYVHRLVAEAYIPNPENKPCVGHKNNNPLDNRASNLYWCTQEENMQQMVRDGRSLAKEKNPAWKDRDFDHIGELYASGMGIIEISKQIGISKHLVQRSIQILFKKLWDERKSKYLR